MALYNHGGWTSCSFPPHIPFSTLKYDSTSNLLHNSTNSYTFKNTSVSHGNLASSTASTTSSTSPSSSDNITDITKRAFAPHTVARQCPSAVCALNKELYQQYSPYLKPAAYLPPPPHTATFPLSPRASAFQNTFKPLHDNGDVFGTHTQPSNVPAANSINAADDPEGYQNFLSRIGIPRQAPTATKEVIVAESSDPPVDFQSTQKEVAVEKPTATEEVVKESKSNSDDAAKALTSSPLLPPISQKKSDQPSWDDTDYTPEQDFSWDKPRRNPRHNNNRRNDKRNNDRSRPVKTSRPTERIRPAPVAALPGWGDAFAKIKADDEYKYVKGQEERRRVGEAFRPAMMETYKRKGKKEVEVYGEVAGKAKVEAEQGHGMYETGGSRVCIGG